MGCSGTTPAGALPPSAGTDTADSAFRPRDWFEHRLFRGPDTDVDMHVFSAGAADVERMLRFRDRLRADDAAQERHVRTERELVLRHPVVALGAHAARGQLADRGSDVRAWPRTSLSRRCRWPR